VVANNQDAAFTTTSKAFSLWENKPLKEHSAIKVRICFSEPGFYSFKVGFLGNV